MKKSVIATAFCFIASSASAQSIRATIEDHFRTVTDSSPKTERVCQTVEVPVYGKAPASTGDTLLGAIIGGAIGNQFGQGSGKDAMTVLGAIAGADVANKSGGRQIVGYTTETRCENQIVFVETVQEIYTHSTVTFVDNGKTYTVRFQR